MNEITDLEAWLHKECAPTAIYFSEADCVEYVSEDTTYVYRRIDPILTLVYDETNAIVIGFKLKGFKKLLEEIRDIYQLDDEGFLELVSVLEAVCSKIGNNAYDANRRSAYAAAQKLAKDVKLYDYPLAA